MGQLFVFCKVHRLAHLNVEGDMSRKSGTFPVTNSVIVERLAVKIAMS